MQVFRFFFTWDEHQWCSIQVDSNLMKFLGNPEKILWTSGYFGWTPENWEFNLKYIYRKQTQFQALFCTHKDTYKT